MGFFNPSPLFTYCLHVSHRKKEKSSLEFSRSMPRPVSCVHHKQVGHSPWRSWWLGSEHALDGHSTEHLCRHSASTPLETLRAAGMKESLSGCQTSPMTLTCDTRHQQPAECIDTDISIDILTSDQEPKVKMAAPVVR